jgi:hypothetical protein
MPFLIASLACLVFGLGWGVYAMLFVQVSGGLVRLMVCCGDLCEALRGMSLRGRGSSSALVYDDDF